MFVLVVFFFLTVLLAQKIGWRLHVAWDADSSETVCVLARKDG